MNLLIFSLKSGITYWVHVQSLRGLGGLRVVLALLWETAEENKEEAQSMASSNYRSQCPVRKVGTRDAHIFRLFALNHLQWLLREVAREVCISSFPVALNLQLQGNLPVTPASWLAAV